MDRGLFTEELKYVRVPMLVLDQKWHRLFAISGKTDEVKAVEAEINELLARQGKLNSEVKSLKKIKADLMQGIVENMDGADPGGAGGDPKKLEENKRLIEETNERLEADEDELLDIPVLLKEKNEQLMLLTMAFTYDKLRSNTDEIKEIADWIADVRVKLKKNIIRKQNREINNKEIYNYMHDIFGKKVVDIFDVHYDQDQKLAMGRADEDADLKAEILKSENEIKE